MTFVRFEVGMAERQCWVEWMGGSGELGLVIA